jgi:hypothetical protein
MLIVLLARFIGVICDVIVRIKLLAASKFWRALKKTQAKNPWLGFFLLNKAV